MKKITYKNIKIEYEDNNTNNLEELKTIIDNNKDFISFLFNKKIKLKNKSIKDLIKEELKSFRDGINIINKNELIDFIYYSYLVLHHDEYNYLKKEIIQIFNPLNDSILLSNIGAVYYNNIDEYVNYICKRNKSEEKKIVEWMKKESRERTFQNMIGRITSSINIDDSKNLELINNFKEELKERLSKEEKNNYKLSKLNQEELEDLMTLFLLKIDESRSLYNKYQEINKQGLIITKKNKEENINHNSYVQDNKINLTLNESTYDFLVLVHEFFHIINNKTQNTAILNELLSIYYEEEAINFLEEIGYSSEECNDLRRIRIDNLIRNIKKTEKIWNHLIKYDKNKKLTKKDIIKELKEEGESKVRNIERTNEINNILNTVSYSKEADKRIDEETSVLVRNAPVLIYYSSYIIGYYFTKEIENCTNKEDIISYYYNNKNRLTVKEIFEIIKKDKKELRR